MNLVFNRKKVISRLIEQKALADGAIIANRSSKENRTTARTYL